ncbi:MAG: hypothetical protein LBV59_01810 [Sphingobacterium sp.]|jgi:mRNA-degrading endonuclease RelE of RelBE toxin-antitoxin system|uniref:hypothetical protein n=1 Tax=Sphingobacterium sp. TaxID=341027 RepID=UPI0028450A62|nr:hypothetical protein [Sphingobacterium sp.]MDR3006636.1 hypothetical protein [Sphingobacterium sp.]
MAFDVLFSSSFKRELKRIAKKHKQILKDIGQLSDDLSNNPKIGIDLGQNVYKIRLSVTGTSKGKSGGERVITYVKFVNETVILAEIYLKNEHDTADVGSIIDRLNNEGLL